MLCPVATRDARRRPPTGAALLEFVHFFYMLNSARFLRATTPPRRRGRQVALPRRVGRGGRRRAALGRRGRGAARARRRATTRAGGGGRLHSSRGFVRPKPDLRRAGRSAGARVPRHGRAGRIARPRGRGVLIDRSIDRVSRAASRRVRSRLPIYCLSRHEGPSSSPPTARRRRRVLARWRTARVRGGRRRGAPVGPAARRRRRAAADARRARRRGPRRRVRARGARVVFSAAWRAQRSKDCVSSQTTA